MLFELEDLLLHDSLVRQVVEDALHSRLRFGNFRPDYWEALHHFILAEALSELALDETKDLDIIVLIRADQVENAARFLRDCQAILFVRVVFLWHVEVHNIGDIFDQRSFRVAFLQHDQQFELPYVEEVEDGADLSFWHVR